MKLCNIQNVKRTLPKNLINEHINLFSKEFEKEFKEVEAKNLTNVYLFSSGICYKNGILFDLYFNTKDVGIKVKLRTYIKTALTLLTTFKTIKIDKGIVLTDVHGSGFFHWFGDVLQKLEAIKSQNIDISAYIVLIPEKIVTEYVIETLKIYKITYRIISKQEKVVVKDLLYIPQITPTGNYRPQLMKNMRDTFKEYYGTTSKKKRIFITRSKAPKRRIINESELLPILEKYHFDIIAMEELTFEEPTINNPN